MMTTGVRVETTDFSADDKYIMHDGSQVGSFITAELAQSACEAMNSHAELVQALRDCVESLQRLPNVEGAYRVTAIRQAEQALDKLPH